MKYVVGLALVMMLGCSHRSDPGSPPDGAIAVDGAIADDAAMSQDAIEWPMLRGTSAGTRASTYDGPAGLTTAIATPHAELSSIADTVGCGDRLFQRQVDGLGAFTRAGDAPWVMQWKISTATLAANHQLSDMACSDQALYVAHFGQDPDHTWSITLSALANDGTTAWTHALPQQQSSPGTAKVRRFDNGDLLVAYGNGLQRITAGGGTVWSHDVSPGSIDDAAIDGDGDVWIAFQGAVYVKKLAGDGSELWTYSGDSTLLHSFIAMATSGRAWIISVQQDNLERPVAATTLLDAQGHAVRTSIGDVVGDISDMVVVAGAMVCSVRPNYNLETRPVACVDETGLQSTPLANVRAGIADARGHTYWTTGTSVIELDGSGAQLAQRMLGTAASAGGVLVAAGTLYVDAASSGTAPLVTALR